MNHAGSVRRSLVGVVNVAVGVVVAWNGSVWAQSANDSGAGSPTRPQGASVTPTAPVRPTGSTAKPAGTKGFAPAGSSTKSGTVGTPTGFGATGSTTNGAGKQGPVGQSPVGQGAAGLGGSTKTGSTVPGTGTKGGPLPSATAPPRAPAWIPLTADHEKYLDDVLKYWQDSSSRVKKYRCSFKRWEYDGANVARDAKTGNLPPRSESTGVIRYASPDKGMFKVERTVHYTPPTKEGERVQYLPHKDEISEHWVCDGKSIYAFDNQKKQLIQTILPPEMQGRAIVDGPLPFMFGAEIDKVKQRFWMRVITPKDSTGEYWLEAVPKTRQDAANFKMVHVIIDEKDFLPKAMSIFNLNHDPVRNPSCMTFSFDKRETNWNDTLENLNVFHREFWEPTTPLGYKKVVETLLPNSPNDASTQPPRQAERPKSEPPKKKQ